MEKYNYSNLTDHQHQRLVDAMERLKLAAETSLVEAEEDANELKRFIGMMESLSFVSPNERKAYYAEIDKTMDEAADRAVEIVAKRLGAHDDTLTGCILQSLMQKVDGDNGA